jgi:hypothetical protein
MDSDERDVPTRRTGDGDQVSSGDNHRAKVAERVRHYLNSHWFQQPSLQTLANIASSNFNEVIDPVKEMVANGTAYAMLDDGSSLVMVTVSRPPSFIKLLRPEDIEAQRRPVVME